MLGALAAVAIPLGVAAIPLGLAAVPLGLFGGALYVLGAGLKQFADIKWSDIGVAVGMLGALTTLALPLAAMAIPLAVGSIGLTTFSIALGVFGLAAGVASSSMESAINLITRLGTINGENLIQVAKGILALGGALIAFTAGSVASSAGNLFGTIYDGMSKLFGGSSIIAQLTEFSVLGPGLLKTSSAINSVASGLQAMVTALNSFTGLSTLQSIVQAVNGINVIKALAFSSLGNSISLPALNSPTNTATASLPPASVVERQKNKEKIISTDSNKKKTDKVAEAEIEKSPQPSDINNILNNHTNLLTQLLVSSNSLVSVNKDILKYARNSA